LESLVRLSEAMARLQCLDQVSKKHVEDAFKLLNKSIIRVEQPDISFGDEEEEEEVEPAETGDDSHLMRDGDQPVEDDEMNGESASAEHDRMDEESNVGDTQTQTRHKKKVLKLSFEEFKSISTILLMYMRREEIRCEESGIESEGLKRSHIINWYLNEIGDDLESEEELVEKKTIVEKIIDKNIRDHVILSVRETTSTRRPAGEEQEEDDPVLFVHPNYVIDEH